MDISVGQLDDVFYPDNPRRRARAHQLEGDCRGAINEFNTLKAKFDEDSKRVRNIMMERVRKSGFVSVPHLNQYILNILNGAELQEWEELKKTLSTYDIISDIVMAVSGISIEYGNATSGALLFMRKMVGPAGLGALGIRSTVTTVGDTGVVIPLAGGALERSILQDAIQNLFVQRRWTYVQLRTLQAYSYCVAKLELFFLDEDLFKHPEKFVQQNQDELQQQTDRAKPSNVSQELAQLDRQRNSWMNEDPTAVGALLGIIVGVQGE